MTSLPAPGTRTWEDIEAEALRIGLDALEHEGGNLANALYHVYTTFRERFLEARGLIDSAPGSGDQWHEALDDARVLEHHVSQLWTAAIIAAFQPSQK